MVWISSLYNGFNSDTYYKIARNLAFDDEYDKALLLCRYILSERPSHMDTRVLSGRINAWRGERQTAIDILKACIKQNPNYIDTYAALFDVYYWDGRHKEALELIQIVRQNSSGVGEIEDKIERAQREARKYGVSYVADAENTLAQTNPE